MSKRILLLVHKDLVPPQTLQKDIDRYKSPWITEYDIYHELIKLNHNVKICPLLDELNILNEMIVSFKPHIVFNLLEEFNFEPRNDFKVVSFLELMNIKYTGCNSKGLMLSRDKALAKKILEHHHILTPKFFTLPKDIKRKLPKSLKFPLIVKCLYEEASYAMAKASIVHNEEKLNQRINYINQKLGQDAIVEEFIEGKELYVGVIGDKKLKTLPIWELKFENTKSPGKEIYSARAKWNEDYRKRKGITSKAAKLDSQIENKIINVCKKVYRVLELSGYARVDLRLTESGKIYILEVNPNPNIAMDDEFAKSARHASIDYQELIKMIL